MSPAPEAPKTAPPSSKVILFALDLAGEDSARDQIVELCTRHGHPPLLLDAAADPMFSEHVKDAGIRAHFPLLCVEGRLIGGLSVVSALQSLGKLAPLLELDSPGTVPTLAISVAAAERLTRAMTGTDNCVRIVISPDFEHELALDSATPDDLVLSVGKLTCVLDRESASRADGVSIDWIEQGDTQGFRVDNPNQPEPLQWVDAAWLEANLGVTESLQIIDVRTRSEYADNPLPGAQNLDGELMDALEQTDRRTPLLFYCGNGLRSRTAAERYREMGFLKVYCLSGGLAALANATPSSGSNVTAGT